MTLTELKELIPILKQNHVSQFKNGGIEISFSASISARAEEFLPPVSPLTEELVKITKKEAEHIPPDLRADDTMSYDKILHWSGSPDPNQPDLALTGEADL